MTALICAILNGILPIEVEDTEAEDAAIPVTGVKDPAHHEGSGRLPSDEIEPTTKKETPVEEKV